MKSLGRYNSLVIPLFTWLILLIPFLFYQRYYVTSQEAYLTEHGFRLLAAVGRQLDSYVDSVARTVTSNPDKGYDYVNTFHPELTAAAFTEVPVNGCTAPRTLAVEFGPRPAAFRRCVVAKVHGRLSLNDTAIGKPLRGIGEDYFDDVLIANANGDILYQRSIDKPRVTKLENLVLAVADKSSPTPAAGKAASPQDKDEPRPFLALSESSSVLEVRLAGDDYKLFLQPLELSRSDKNAEDSGRLVLAGLWRTQGLNSKSLALPYSYVIWFGLFGVAAGCFVWPFLKINYMSHTERLRRSQGWVLLLSIFLGAVSVTLMVLNASYAAGVQKNIDLDLKTLAKQMQRNVDDEIRRAWDQLAELSDLPEVQDHTSAEIDFRPKALEHIIPSPSVAFYPYFDSAFWVGEDGWQVVKFAVDRNVTPKTPVKDRSYFRSVWPSQPVVPLLAELDGRPYSLEPLTSKNTGEFQAVIAAPFKTRNPKNPIKVQALVIRPLSLVEPVFPPDFGFAVLDRDGRVLFHTNPLRNLSENFINECKDTSAEALQAALFSNSDQNLDIIYSGKERRVRVTKIEHLGPEPYTLIVFHNTEINLTVNMAIVLIGSVLMGLYTLAILGVAAYDLLRGAKYPPEWIWPRRAYAARYALISVTNSLLILFFLFRYSYASEMELLFLTVIILGLAAAFTLFLLKKRQLPIAPARWSVALRPHFKKAYVAAAVSALTAATIVPCFGFFKFSYDAANELAAKHGQLRVFNDLLERRQHISDSYHNLQTPRETEYASRRISARLDRYDDLPLEFLSYKYHSDGKSDEEPDGNTGRSFQQRFDDLLQQIALLFPSNTIGGQMRVLNFDPSKDNGDNGKDVAAMRFERSEPKLTKSGGEVFRLEWQVNKVADKDLTVDAQFAEWSGVDGGRWLWLFLLWAFAGAWFFLLIKKIFLPENHKPLALEQVNWQSRDEINGNFLVLGDPFSGKSCRLASIPGLEGLDLRVEPNLAELKTFVAGDIVVLDHFDFNFDNPACSQARLLLLERLLYKDRCKVVLVSSIDPVYYLSAGALAIPAENSHPGSELRRRWTTVMSTFSKVEFDDPSKLRFEKELDPYRHDPQVQPLLEWIEEECRHSAYLRDLGLDLFRRHRNDAGFDPHALRHELAERSENYYSLLWSTLTTRERLALYQLAHDGWINTKNDRAVRELQRKRVVRCEAMCRFVNESFRLFALRTQDKREIAEWERQGRQSLWHSLKIAIMATVVGLTAWLFYAQQDLFQVSIGYVVALGGGITAITNILGSFKGRAPKVPAAEA